MLKKTRLLITTIILLNTSNLLAALPPTIVNSAYHIPVHAVHDGSTFFKIEAGEYKYHFLWDSGPISLVVIAINGYDSNGLLIESFEPIVNSPKEITGNRQANQTNPANQLEFQGQGIIRYAKTLDAFSPPNELYLNSKIQHASVIFKLQDGRMSVGPWIRMSEIDFNLSYSVIHSELLLW